MSRFFLQWTFLFAFAFAAVNAIAIAAGNRQPPHPAVAGFTVGCVQPALACYAARLLFAHNIAVIDTLPVDRTSLYSPISLIDLSPINVGASGEPTFGWHGLLPEWRYCRLQPDAPVCPMPEVRR